MMTQLQCMADRRASEIELDTHDSIQTTRKLPHLLHDQDTDDDSHRPSKRARADFRPPRNYNDNDGMQSSPGRSQRRNFREDVPMTDQTDDDGYEDDDDQEAEFEMYRV
ncbi:hypothetical protein CerSpe_172040 [Prunus speciosa]